MPINSVALANTFNEFRTTVNDVITIVNAVSDVSGVVNANTLIGGTVTANNLTSGRVTLATTSGQLTDDSALTYDTATDILTLAGTTDASSSTTGTLKVAGGLGVAKKLYVGTDLAVTANTTLSGTTDASSSTTGAVIITGGVGIAKKLYVGTDLAVSGNATITGDLTVNGTTTTVNSTTLTVDDKNIELGSVATPTDVTADGGGITLKGATDKSITWSSIGWTSSEDFNLVTGKTFEINGTSVLSATTLGSGVTGSSLTSVGTIGTGVWQGTLIGPTYGGTGVNNGVKTVTLGGNLVTSGAFNTTLTATANTTVTLPTSGTLVGSADTGTVTSTMIADGTIVDGDINASAAIAVSKLASSAVTVGTTAITLGTSSTTLAGLTSVTSTSFVGALTGNASTVTTNANLTGGVTSVGNAATVVTNANLTGDVTSVGNATTLTNAPVIAKVLTGYVSGAGTVAATDSILQAIQKLDGNQATNANLTGAVTSVGNATSLGSFTSAQLLGALTDETGTGAAVFATSPTLVTPALGTPSALVGTNITGTATSFTASNVTTNANLTGHITSVGNAAVLGSFTSAQLLAALTDETGTGAAVFATSPTLVTPALGAATGTSLALTGTLSGGTSGTAYSFSGSAPATSLTLTSAGLLGIGTSSPIHGLHVYNNSDVWHTAFGGATGILRIGGQTPAGAVIQSFNPSTSAVRDLYLQRDGGNVGIGTSSPATKLDVSGTVTATAFSGPLTGAVTGNASTATTLQTARAINGVSFDGSAAITVTAAAGTLSGATLSSGVTASSLTSVGTISSGVWNGSSISTTYTDAKVTSIVAGTNISLSGATGAVTVNVSGTVASAALLVNAGGSGIYSSTAGTAYSQVINIRESGLNGVSGSAPRLGFHWSGVVASSIAVESSGRIAIQNNPGTGYEALVSGAFTATTGTFSSTLSASNLSGTNTGDQTNISGNAATATTAGTVTTAAQPSITSVGTLTSVTTSGPIYRSAAGAGYLNGQYSSAESGSTSGAIYSIGGAYVPGTTTLGNMYGVGYSYSNVVAGTTGAPGNTWGFYGASGGTSRFFLDSDNGRGYFASDLYVNNGSLVLSAGNYNSYAPTLTGTGASGTWSISVTGNSGTVGGFTPTASSGVANRVVVANASGYIDNSYFYTSGGGSERSASGLGYFAGFNSGDYYIRSYTPAAVATAISGQTMNISGSATSATTAGTVTTAAQPSITSVGTLTGLTVSGTSIYSDQLHTRAMLIDCGITFLDKGNSSTTTQTLDYTAGSHQKITATGAFTIATSNFPPSGNLGELLLEIVNGGSQTITFPTINWIKSDGTTTTSVSTYLAANTGRIALQTSGTDFILLWSRDAGTTIYGKLV